MSNTPSRIEDAYHLLSEIDPKKGLNIAATPGEQEYVAFSRATQSQLKRLQQHLGSNSSEVTPRFKEDGGMAVLSSIEMGQDFTRGEAASKLIKLSGRQFSLPVHAFHEDDIARITSKPVERPASIA